MAARAMSRAFVKEGDDGGDADDLPERSLPAHPNYVTARGLTQLQVRTRELAARCEALRRVATDDSAAKQDLRVAERDLRYFRTQLERAELVVPGAQPDEVHFGASITLVGDDGEQQRVRIVGDDEADAVAGDISWASPLARALIGARVGEIVTWRRPAGAAEIEILAIHYAQS
jgi:transcription elongation factor GreB